MLATRMRMAAANAFSVAFLTSAQSAASTITIPASARTGDVAVLLDIATNHSTSTPASVVPSGWTQLGNSTDATGGDRARCVTSYKILGASDPGAVITGMNDTSEEKLMLVFRATRPIVTVTPSVWNAETGNGGSPSNQTVSASGQTTPLIVIGAGGSDADSSFPTETPAFTSTVATSDSDGIMGYTIYNSGPQNHTIGMSGSGNSNSLHSGYLTVAS